MDFCSTLDESSQISNLFTLEEFSNLGGKIEPGAVLTAIQADISLAIPISKALLFKYISNKKIFQNTELKALVEILKLAIVATLELKPLSAQNYTESAVLVLEEIRKRSLTFDRLDQDYRKAA